MSGTERPINVCFVGNPNAERQPCSMHLPVQNKSGKLAGVTVEAGGKERRAIRAERSM